MRKLLYIIVLAVVLAGCDTRRTPKPTGYWRIHIPDTCYQKFSDKTYPYSFDYSCYADIKELKDREEKYWLNLHYKAFNVDIHCTYLPVRNNLRSLSDDAQAFIYKHASIATGIPEQGYENPEENIYGVYYELEGNTASPLQFYVTDSTANFFRVSVYFNCPPKEDSLAPVLTFLKKDIRHMIESFRWQ